MLAEPRAPPRVQFGDGMPHAVVTPGNPIFTKARLIHGRCGTLLPLETPRHWLVSAKGISFQTYIPWVRKRADIYWRGGLQGADHATRRDFVHALSPRFNVRFMVQRAPHESWSHPWVTHANHSERRVHKIGHAVAMRYKYVLSLEGNDVATNLKWLMSQNSVILMPTPTKETWLMEGMLVPWVHYVPLDKPSQVDERLAWLESHERECLQIVANANAWIRAVLGELHDLVGPVMRSALMPAAF